VVKVQSIATKQHAVRRRPNVAQVCYAALYQINTRSCDSPVNEEGVCNVS
jgi:hypothetical protein